MGTFQDDTLIFFSALKNHLEKYKEESKEQHISLEKTIIFQKVSRAQTQHFVAIRSTGSRSWPKKNSPQIRPTED